EELVVEIGAQQRAVGCRELMPHEPAHDARRGEESERRDDEATADYLVIVRFEPADQGRLVGPSLLERTRGGGIGRAVAHRPASLWRSGWRPSRRLRPGHDPTPYAHRASRRAAPREARIPLGGRRTQ